MNREEHLDIAKSCISLDEEIETMICKSTTDEDRRNAIRENIRHAIRTHHFYSELERH